MKRTGYGISYALLLLFLMLLVLGINTGEVEAVLEKGISICLSCMGIE
ncbi:MAG: CD1871A family CXXC motif-containing protein [Desulfohalobiaceae bacterium]